MPDNYDCPFCRLVSGENDEVNTQDCVVYEDSQTIAFVSPKWWLKNEGHVLVIPKQHIENLFEISDELLAVVYRTVKKLAMAIKVTYPSDGISTRQHNEPAGNQDVWHFHVHVFPRYTGDNLYQNHLHVRWPEKVERVRFATMLREYLAK